MVRPLAKLALASLIASPFVAAIAPSEIPSDTPVAQLIKTANTELAAGNTHDAFAYFDVAIQRDPQNYLTIFKRGAAYLSLGKSQQARRDFDKVLELKPGFEGALIQRAKLRARHGEWTEAEKDYTDAGKQKDSKEIQELNEAHGSALLAETAADNKNWEECVQHSGAAIMIANGDLELRKLRAKCRFERGEVVEGVSDLQHVLAINSGDTEPHIKISALQFYAMAETDAGLAQIRKCLQSDPESKSCRKLMKREKALDKLVKKVQTAIQKKQNVGATKILLKNGEEPGLLAEVKSDFEQYQKDGLIHENSKNGLYIELLDITCQAYVEMNSLKKGKPYCEEILTYDPSSMWGLIAQARALMDKDEFEAAIRSLNDAKETHGNTEKINKLLNEAQTLLRRSKQKDYYKVLELDRDADEQDIKKAKRRLARKYHPDKAQGMTQDEAQKKMAAINEAYEVLSDPEKKAMFDRGQDPNDPQAGNPFHGSPFGGGGGGQQFMFQHGGGSGQFHFQGFPGGFPFG